MRLLKMFLLLLLLIVASPMSTRVEASAIKTSGPSSSVKAVKKRATAFLKAVKRYDQKTINKSFLPRNMRKDISYFDKGYGVDKMCRKLNRKHFTYKIKRISVSENSAKVKVRVTYYAGYDLCGAAFLKTVDYFNGRVPDGKTILKRIYIYMTRYYKQYKDPGYYVDSKTITLPYKKHNGNWYISSMSRSLSDVVNCEFATTIEDCV